MSTNMITTEAKKINPLPKEIMDTIVSCARAFDVDVIWLFGSALETPENARDIDLAVEGLAYERFYKFYAELDTRMPKQVDLVDLSEGPWLEPIIRDRGIRIYER